MPDNSKQFKRGQKVTIVTRQIMGPDRVEAATILRYNGFPSYSDPALMVDYWAVKFADGGKISVHESALRTGL